MHWFLQKSKVFFWINSKSGSSKLSLRFPDTPIDRYDERFSSKMAFQTMIDAGLTKKNRRNKNIVDKISATIILQGYLKSKEK